MIDTPFDMAARVRASTSPVEQRRQAEREFQSDYIAWERPQSRLERVCRHIFRAIIAAIGILVLVAAVYGLGRL